jgi:hypothetical protein
MNEKDIRRLLMPLGLTQLRAAFCGSMMEFINSHTYRDLQSLNNDELISLIATGVYGAGFKVAQCCALYMKGYYCGVIPVDSGMRDKLSLCIGMRVSRTATGHEIMRRELERLVAQLDCRSIAAKTGYHKLSFPAEGSLSWWAHLVLIYYKRLYCNRPVHRCPLRTGPDAISGACSLHHGRRDPFEAI